MVPAQPAQRLGHHDRLHRGVGGVGFQRFGQQLRRRGRPALAARQSSTTMFLATVNSQPRAEASCWASTAGSPPGSEQGLLHDVLGPAPITAGEVQDESPQRRRVLVVQDPQQFFVRGRG